MTNTNTNTNNDKARKAFFTLLDKTAARIVADSNYKIKSNTLDALVEKFNALENVVTEVVDLFNESTYKTFDEIAGKTITIIKSSRKFSQLVYRRADELKNGVTGWSSWFVVDLDDDDATADSAADNDADVAELAPAAPSTLNGKQVFDNGALWQYDAAEYFKKAGAELTNKRIHNDAYLCDSVHGSREKGYDAETITCVGREICKHVKSGGRCLIWRGSYVIRVFYFDAPEKAATVENAAGPVARLGFGFFTSPEQVDDATASAIVADCRATRKTRQAGCPTAAVVRMMLMAAGAVSLDQYKAQGGALTADGGKAVTAFNFRRAPSWAVLGNVLNTVENDIENNSAVVGFVQDCGALRVYFYYPLG